MEDVMDYIHKVGSYYNHEYNGKGCPIAGKYNFIDIGFLSSHYNMPFFELEDREALYYNCSDYCDNAYDDIEDLYFMTSDDGFERRSVYGYDFGDEISFDELDKKYEILKQNYQVKKYHEIIEKFIESINKRFTDYKSKWFVGFDDAYSMLRLEFCGLESLYNNLYKHSADLLKLEEFHDKIYEFWRKMTIDNGIAPITGNQNCTSDNVKKEKFIIPCPPFFYTLTFAMKMKEYNIYDPNCDKLRMYDKHWIVKTQKFRFNERIMYKTPWCHYYFLCSIQLKDVSYPVRLFYHVHSNKYIDDRSIVRISLLQAYIRSVQKSTFWVDYKTNDKTIFYQLEQEIQDDQQEYIYDIVSSDLINMIAEMYDNEILSIITDEYAVEAGDMYYKDIKYRYINIPEDIMTIAAKNTNEK